MKTATHPKYYDTVVSCVCGATHEIGCSIENLKVEICSECHPFFTGKEKLMDREGRVEKFKSRYAAAANSTRRTKKKKS